MTATTENPLIEKLVLKLAKEQIRARRWSVFFKLVFVFYLLLIFGVAMQGTDVDAGLESQKPHTAMVRISGMIGEGDGMGGSADQVAIGLRAAFEAKHSKAVLLRINSPGGTPVNASMVYDEILRLKKKYPEKKVYSAITDMGTSGAYYIAAASDEIYANSASIVGSIGVISPGYGFVGLMDKLGVERRIFSAGENKAMLDPFSPLQESQKRHFDNILTDVHQKFVDDVKAGRGDKLVSDEVIFSGLFWSGVRAKELGLIDGFSSPGAVSRDIIGLENMVDYTSEPRGFERFLSLVNKPFERLFSAWREPTVMAVPAQY